MTEIKRNRSAPLVMYIIAAAMWLSSAVITYTHLKPFVGSVLPVYYVMRFLDMLPYAMFILHGVFFKKGKSEVFMSIGLICSLGMSAYYVFDAISGYGFYRLFESRYLIGYYEHDLLNLLFFVPVLIDSFVKTSSRSLSKIFLILRLVFSYALTFVLWIPDMNTVFNSELRTVNFFISIFSGQYDQEAYIAPMIALLLSGLAFLFTMIGHLAYIGEYKAEKEPAQLYQNPNQPQ